MIKFGPGGNSISFYQQGYERSEQAPKWLNELGLDAYEYSLGRGINIKKQTAESIGQQAKQHGITMSVHAPYFINYASADEQRVAASHNYVLSSLEVADNFGAKTVVFHTASCSKMPRNQAMQSTLKNVSDLVESVCKSKLSHINLAPETMGRLNQIGTVDEIVEICKIDSLLIPAIDFGHIHCLGGGSLTSVDDYRKIMDKLIDGIGDRVLKNLHIHFSKIQYGKSGEIKHLTFADTEFGPDPEPFAQMLVEYNPNCVVISESAGTMAEDALIIKKMYKNFGGVDTN